MSQSLLLKIVRESIAEVFEAKKIINKEELLHEYPILNEPLACFVHIYIDNELRGSSGKIESSSSLLDAIIYHAKIAAFQDKAFEPLSVAQYLRARIQLSLFTPLVELHYQSIEEVPSQLTPNEDGLYLSFNQKSAFILPQAWSQYPNPNTFVAHLIQQSELNETELSSHPKFFSFQVETSIDDPILT